MNLQTERYLEQLRRWPVQGRHILAQFDANTVIVYQAFRPEIANFAVQHQRFGGEFSFKRMSWIKPNFLWMMYRSGWGTKEGQVVTLAIQLQRAGFHKILEQAVHSNFQQEYYGTPERWKTELSASEVRLQWDPDHSPSGEKQERRAIQLGLSGDILRRYCEEWIVSIEDISQFAKAQRAHAVSGDFGELWLPREEVMAVNETTIAARLGLNRHTPHL
jgi:hypothetical protein